MDKGIKIIRYSILFAGFTISVLPWIEGKPSSIMFALIFFFWSFLPYGVFFIISSRLKKLSIIMTCGLSILAFDIILKIDILFFPSSSTAPIGLIIIPFLLLILILPIGIFLGWLLSKGLHQIKLSNMVSHILSSLVIVLVFIILGLSTFIAPSFNRPERKTGVNISNHNIKKELLLQDFFPGYIRNIQYLEIPNSQKKEIAILSQSDIIRLNADDLTTSSKVSLVDKKNNRIWVGLNPYLIDIDNDGIYEIMEGGEGYGKIGILDSKGKRIWEFKHDSNLHPNKMIVGDLNKDTIPEFYVADRSGLFQLNTKGQIVWKVGNDSILDIDIISVNDLLPDIAVSIDHNNLIQFWDFQGKMLRKITPEVKIDRIVPILWSGAVHFLSKNYGNNAIIILNLDGKSVFKKNLSNFLAYHAQHAISVQFSPNKEPYLAIIAYSSSTIGTSQLTILNSSGIIIYQETIKGHSPLFAHSIPGVKSQVLLIGEGTDKIYKYKLAN